MKKVLVVGGGSAGLIAAMILKKHLNIEVDIVYSDSIGIIGVGEGSTEHFSEFLEFVGIDYIDFIKNTDATLKSGVMFQNWTDKPYLHSVHPIFAEKTGQYSNIYGRQISNNSNYLSPKMLWENKIDSSFLNFKEKSPVNQYHFDTFKLNNYMSNYANKTLNIKLYEDTVRDVIINFEGKIEKIIGEKQEYTADFYIDATGFKKILIEKLGGKWKSYSKYLKMNTAITFPTKENNKEENYNMWTLSKAMNSGWMFNIPVWGRSGNGYIYNNEYINEENAIREIEQFLGKKIEISRKFTFDPGRIDRAWIGNCCAVGLSSSFFEPLEASSIGTSIQQSFLLMHMLVNYDQKTINKYNNMFDDIVENIKDFISLHYITNRKDTNFWKDIKNVELPESLINNLEVWKNRLPIREDFIGKSNYILFKENNYILVMHGLGLFNIQKIFYEYSSRNIDIQKNSDFIIKNYQLLEENIKKINHKEYLKYIRE